MEKAGAADGPGDVEAPVLGRQAAERILDAGAQVAAGIALGLQPLQRAVPLDLQGQALIALELAAEEGGADDEAGESDAGGGVAPLQAADRSGQVGGDGGAGAQKTVGTHDADRMIVHGGTGLALWERGFCCRGIL